MKKKHFSLLLVSVLCLAVSCSKDTLTEAPAAPDTGPQSAGNILSMDQVRSLALSLPATFSDGPDTRAAAGKTIKEIVPFSRFVPPPPATRSVASGEQSAGDPVENIYVVNYADDQGFAIISADKRLPYLLGYSDNGSVTEHPDNPGLAILIQRLPVFLKNIYAEMEKDNTVITRGASRDSIAYSDWFYDIGPFYFIQNTWGQNTPFTNFIPNRAAVGCVPTALMQIFSLYRMPKSVTYNKKTYTMNWNAYAAIKSDNPVILWSLEPRLEGISLANVEEVSALARVVGDAIGTHFGEVGGQSPTSIGAKQFFNGLSSLGYSSAGKWIDYKAAEVKNAIDDAMTPVLVTGKNANTGTDHTWIIDAFEQYAYRVKSTYSITDGVATLAKTETETNDAWPVVHCNWGWYGKANGWFVSGIFGSAGAEGFDRYPNQDPADHLEDLEGHAYYSDLIILKGIKPKNY